MLKISKKSKFWNDYNSVILIAIIMKNSEDLNKYRQILNMKKNVIYHFFLKNLWKLQKKLKNSQKTVIFKDSEHHIYIHMITLLKLGSCMYGIPSYYSYYQIHNEAFGTSECILKWFFKLLSPDKRIWLCVFLSVSLNYHC